MIKGIRVIKGGIGRSEDLVLGYSDFKDLLLFLYLLSE